MHSTIDTDFPLVQSLDGAHALGCHHIVTDAKGTRAVSAGFGGDIKVWACQDGSWSADAVASCMCSYRRPQRLPSANPKPIAHLKDVHVWAVALSEDGRYLAGVSQDGHVGVWDLTASGTQIRDHETKGSFGTCIDLVSLCECPS